MLQSWFNEKMKKQVLINNIIDEKHFLDEVSIYLSAVPNLFSKEGILGKELTSDHHNYGQSIKHIDVKITFETR
ncbi:MAG: hypothetical protein GDA46_02075 [Bdellovibrionales bacterium]|nr:hypothetical protein [Bdellovibrionales bacterium]